MGYNRSGKKIAGYVGGGVLLCAITGFGAYMVTGMSLKADMPLVRDVIEPVVVADVDYSAYSVASTWEGMKSYVEEEYKVMYEEGETEDEFYERMSDLDRRSMHQFLLKYPGLLEGGISDVMFDIEHGEFSGVLTEEEKEQLVKDIEAGEVKTKRGDRVLAVDGRRSMILVSTPINETEGYLAIGYDKSKFSLVRTKTAFAGWWSLMGEHIEDNKDAVVAIPANDYTYNSKSGYGLVTGGIVENRLNRYKESNNYGLYMGITELGEFRVGDKARMGVKDFSEGLGVLLSGGEIPVEEIVPRTEQQEILEALAAYIENSGENPEEEGYDAVPLIRGYIEQYDVTMIRAKVAWVIKNKAIVESGLPDGEMDIIGYVERLEENEGASEDMRSAVELVRVCDEYGAGKYAELVEPTRSAYTAVGQRGRDGAVFLFGVGGAKIDDSQDLVGNGAKVEEIQELMLGYEVSEASMTTSGDRVGFGWKGKNLVHVQDTTDDGARSYGAYIIK